MRRTTLTAALLATGLVAALAAGPVSADPAPAHEPGGAVFTGETTKSVLPAQVRSVAGRPGSTSSITYHNGPVMTAAGGTKVYYVYYGSWSSAQKSIVEDFAGNVGGSPYFGINTTYYDAAGKKVVNAVSLAGSYDYQGTPSGTALSDAQIQSLITAKITDGTLPSDRDAVYFLLTGAGVTASSGFLTKYCGWHTYTTLASTPIKYSFVGNATGASLGSCAAQTASSPNGDPGVDAMISVLAHELEEAVTDPQLNAWYDRSGYENADKCAWTFGTTSTASNGSKYNVTLGSRQFLIQRNWKASTQSCGMS